MIYESISDYLVHNNFIGRSLSGNLSKAYEMRTSMVDHFLGLSIIRGKESVELWENEPTEAWFSDGEWHSIYQLRESKRGCFFQ